MTNTTIISLDSETTFASVPALICTAAYALVSWARTQGVEGLPVTVEQVEAAMAADLKYSNYEYERTTETFQDLVNTIERRLPAGMTLEAGINLAPALVYVEAHTE